MLKRDKTTKTGKWIWLVFVMLAAVYGIVVFGFVHIMYSLASIYNQMGLFAELITALMGIGCLVVLLFGLISMLNILYFSRDTEFFLALPVKMSTIYFAKLTVVYFTELIVSSLMLIPLFITAGVAAGMGPVYYIVTFLANFLIPVLPLLIASILAIPLMYLVSFFKNKGALSSVVIIVLFGAFFALYFLAINSFQNIATDGETDPQVIFEATRAAFVVLSNVLFPLTCLAKVAALQPVFGLSLGLSVLVNLLIFLAFIGVFAFLVYLISNTVYKKGAASQLEGAKSKAKGNITYKSSGVIGALMKKEWRELIRTPSFAFQCLSGLIISPIFIIIMSVSFGSIAGTEEMVGIDLAIFKYLQWFIILGMATMMGVGMNIGASTCITREGKMFYYSKILPIPYSVQVKAKALLYHIISLAVTFVGIIVMGIVMMDPLMLLLSLGYLIIYGYGFVNFAIVFDLQKPKLNWNTPNEAVKNSRNATLPMLISMVISIIMIVVPVVCLLLMPEIWVGVLVAWVVMYVVALAAAFIFHNLLRANVDRLYNRINV